MSGYFSFIARMAKSAEMAKALRKCADVRNPHARADCYREAGIQIPDHYYEEIDRHAALAQLIERENLSVLSPQRRESAA